MYKIILSKSYVKNFTYCCLIYHVISTVRVDKNVFVYEQVQLIVKHIYYLWKRLHNQWGWSFSLQVCLIKTLKGPHCEVLYFLCLWYSLLGNALVGLTSLLFMPQEHFIDVIHTEYIFFII